MTTEIFLQKFKLIYSRFLIIAVSFIIGYTFLHWLLFIKFNILDIDEIYLNLWLPFALPWIPLFIWLNPRVKLLKRNVSKSGRKGNTALGYLFVAAFAIAIPTIIAQEYIEVATGKLTPLSSINDISKQMPTKYYSINNYYIDKQNRVLKYNAEVTGKNEEYIDLNIYIASPIYDKTVLADTSQTSDTQNQIPLYLLDNAIVDSQKIIALQRDQIASAIILRGVSAVEVYGKKAVKGAMVFTTKNYDSTMVGKSPAGIDSIFPPPAWLCVKYYQQISNNSSDSTIKREEDDFYVATEQRFADRDLDSFIYLDRINHSSDREGYKKAIERFPVTGDAPIILEPISEAFEKRSGNKFAWIFGSFGIGAAVALFVLLLIKFDDEKLYRFTIGQQLPETDADEKDFYKFLVPKKGFYVTPIIIYINVAVFITMVCCGLGFVNFDIQGLLHWGADYGPYTTNGEWWRLLTCVFVHAGFMHLLLNMYGLLYVGIFLEPVIGEFKYGIAYLVTGIIASVTSLYFHIDTVSIGASGAIFGLYGVFLALLLLKVFPKSVSKAFLISTSLFIVYNLVLGFSGKGTDNAAHIGGLVSGLVVGLFMRPFLVVEHESEIVESIIEN
jgi:rhomboid protease GluP